MPTTRASSKTTTPKASSTPDAHLISTTEDVEVTENNQEGTLKVAVNVQEYSDYESLKRLDVTISQKLGRARKFTNIGYMVAFFVDKRIKLDKKKIALWTQELLRNDDQDAEDQTHQLRDVSRELFTKAGAARAKVANARQELEIETFVFIDNFELYPKHRLRGAGVQPMRMFLGMVPQIVGRDAGSEDPRTVCMLSPARSAAARVDDKSDVQVENGLKRTYGRNNFQVWLQGAPEVENSLTVMGQVL